MIKKNTIAMFFAMISFIGCASGYAVKKTEKSKETITKDPLMLSLSKDNALECVIPSVYGVQVTGASIIVNYEVVNISESKEGKFKPSELEIVTDDGISLQYAGNTTIEYPPIQPGRKVIQQIAFTMPNKGKCQSHYKLYWGKEYIAIFNN